VRPETPPAGAASGRAFDDHRGRISSERLVGVGAAFVGAAGALALVGTVAPGLATPAGWAIVALIAAYAVFGAVIVVRAGRRVGTDGER
jgi:hypothetical protein